MAIKGKRRLQMGFRLTDAEAWAMVAAAHSGVLTTLRRDGRPVPLPVWHVVADGAVFLKTPARSKKLTRIAHDPRGSLLVESGIAWAELSAVVLPVRASVVSDPDEATTRLAAIDDKYAAFSLAPEDLPRAVAAAYTDMRVVRLDPDGPFLSWDNAALLR
jgi:hypothetical protein